MADKQHHCEMNRRTFLKSSAGAAAAVGLSGLAYGQEAPSLEKRVLGRTKMEVSTVSLGAMRTSVPAVMQAAFDRGVNYIDTARAYMDGNNERIVGQALKGYRDKVFVATKCRMFGPKDEIMRSCEESLQSLQIDYIDVFQLHHPAKEEMCNDEAKAAFAELKKQGKIRFGGVTVHNDEVGVLTTATDDPDKTFDIVLTTYHYKSPPEVREAIARAAQSGIGIIAMKTQQGGYKTEELGDVSPHQASLKFVLADANVACAIPSMVDLDQVNEDTGVMGMKLTREDMRILERYAAAVAPFFCLRCGACEPTCPLRVDIPTVNRALMYAEGYGDMSLARNTYRELPAAKTAAVCGDCEVCTAQCVNSIRISERMQTARRLFA